MRLAARRKLEHELGLDPALVRVRVDSTSSSSSSDSPDSNPESDPDAEEDLHFVTRILYVAPSCGRWGEHEVDYILFMQKDFQGDDGGDVDVGPPHNPHPPPHPHLRPNPNEVEAVRYVSRDELANLLALSPGEGDERRVGEQVEGDPSSSSFPSSTDTETYRWTPWFRLICDTFLFPWWDRLLQANDNANEYEKALESGAKSASKSRPRPRPRPRLADILPTDDKIHNLIDGGDGGGDGDNHHSDNN